MPHKLPSDAPPPRRCVIEKLPGENEYGYNLHAEKNRGQFVGLVDAGSPAQRGGLLQGDRIFAVNGHSIIGENHKKVVERIKAQPERCEMLVLSEDGVKWYQDQNIQITLDVLEQALENNVSRPSNGSPPPSSWYAPTTYSQSKLQETPVFVPPPPPTQHYHPMAPLPRLAKLEKSFPEQEFGFNLHAEREKGHFIGIVDENGIGQKAGLEMGQRIVGVNGKLIYPNTGHKEVVALIKKSPMSTTLLVVSEETDKWHRDHGVAYSFDHYEQPPTHPIEVETHHHEEVHATPAKTNGYEVAPALNPHSIQVNEEREISKLTTTTKTEVISTNTASYQYKETTETYDAYAVPPADTSDDLMAQVFGKVDLPAVGNQVTIQSHTKELSTEDASSVSSLSSHRESAVDVPVNHQYVPSYVSQSHEDRHSQTHNHQHQQPSPLSNGSSHGYAASSTSGYDDDDIYHLSAKEARERLRMKNRKHHMHEMSLTEKYQLVSNM